MSEWCNCDRKSSVVWAVLPQQCSGGPRTPPGNSPITMWFSSDDAVLRGPPGLSLVVFVEAQRPRPGSWDLSHVPGGSSEVPVGLVLSLTGSSAGRLGTLDSSSSARGPHCREKRKPRARQGASSLLPGLALLGHETGGGGAERGGQWGGLEKELPVSCSPTPRLALNRGLGIPEPCRPPPSAEEVGIRVGCSPPPCSVPALIPPPLPCFPCSNSLKKNHSLEARE